MINTMFEFDEVKHKYIVRVGAAQVGELYIESDGFYVFEATERKTGYWPAWLLRNIADKLDELNREWQEILEAEVGEGVDTEEVLK